MDVVMVSVAQLHKTQIECVRTLATRYKQITTPAPARGVPRPPHTARVARGDSYFDNQTSLWFCQNKPRAFTGDKMG